MSIAVMSCIMCIWCHEHGLHVWQKCNCLFNHITTLFQCSLIKSKPTWRRSEELKFEDVKYLCYIKINRTTVRSLQMEIFVYFLRLQTSLCPLFGSSLSQHCGHLGKVQPGGAHPSPGMPKTHHAMTTHNHSIPDRSPPGSTRTAPSTVHQDGGVKCATGASSKIRVRDNITIGTWNTRTLRAAGKLPELTHEMDRYRWSIHGLCEMRWKNFDETTTEEGHN